MIDDMPWGSQYESEYSVDVRSLVRGSCGCWWFAVSVIKENTSNFMHLSIIFETLIKTESSCLESPFLLLHSVKF